MAIDEGFSVAPPTAVPASGLDLAKIASGRVVEARVASLAEGLAVVTTRHGSLQVDLAAFGQRPPAVGETVRLQVQAVEGGGRLVVVTAETTTDRADDGLALVPPRGDPAAQVLAEAIRGAAANQTGFASLYAALSGLAAAPADAVPEPVAAAVARLLRARLADDGAPNADAVRRAFLGSGLFLESRLAASPGTTATPGEDLKAALFGLRAVLGRWIGGTSGTGTTTSGTGGVAFGTRTTLPPAVGPAARPLAGSGGASLSGVAAGATAASDPSLGPIGRLIGSTYGAVAAPPPGTATSTGVPVELAGGPATPGTTPATVTSSPIPQTIRAGAAGSLPADASSPARSGVPAELAGGPATPGTTPSTITPSPVPETVRAGAAGLSPGDGSTLAPSGRAVVSIATGANPPVTVAGPAASLPPTPASTPRPLDAPGEVPAGLDASDTPSVVIGVAASVTPQPASIATARVTADDAAVAALLRSVVRGLEIAGGLTPLNSGEAGEIAAALGAIGPGREARPPPPRRGQAPRGQSALPSEPIGADGIEGLGRRALERTEGALSRILLEQVAALDRRGDDQTPASEARAVREWTVDMPIATRDGTGVVQMTVERDGGRDRATVKAGEPGWRVRFSMDVEPLGPIHAQVGLVGEKLSIGLWAERPDAASRLGDEVGRLQGALEAAAIPVESIHLATGRPATVGPAPSAGRFIDLKL